MRAAVRGRFAARPTPRIRRTATGSHGSGRRMPDRRFVRDVSADPSGPVERGCGPQPPRSSPRSRVPIATIGGTRPGPRGPVLDGGGRVWFSERHGAVEAGGGDRGSAAALGGDRRDERRSAPTRPRCAPRRRLRCLSLPAFVGDRDRQGSHAFRAGPRRARRTVRPPAGRTRPGRRRPAHARTARVVPSRSFATHTYLETRRVRQWCRTRATGGVDPRLTRPF